MKNHFKLAAITGFIAASMFSSCEKDNNPIMPQKNIVDIVVNDNNFSMLKTAVVHANLTSVLSGKGPFTVFAPTNEAFMAAGFDTEAKIKAVPAETLKKILLYHVVAQEIKSSAIQMASNTPVKTVAESNIFVTKNANGVFINGATVTKADIMASNGVIHVINKLLMPAAGNIVEVAQSNPDFSFLVAAVLRASEGSTNVAQVLSGTGPFTVFAPTNQAFMNAGFATTAAIKAADPNLLAGILTYHVVSGTIFSSDLTEGATPKTLNGGVVTVTVTGGAKVKGKSNTTASSVTSANMIATNGVIHAIDQVLLP